MFLDLNIIPTSTLKLCDELPLPRPMAGRASNAQILEDLPPVRRMGN